MVKLTPAVLVTLTAQTMFVARVKRASSKLFADRVKPVGLKTGAARVKRAGWKTGADRVKRAACRMLVAPVNRVARGMFLLPAGLIGQVSGSPSAPPKGAGLMQDALNWALWGGLILSALAAAGGAGTIGVSRISGQANHSNTGKQVLMGGLFGAAGVGLAIPVVNMLFAAAGR
jgi:hypothetical protein